MVPQLRETAAWLAVMVPEVCKAILSTDPASILACDMDLVSDLDRRVLVCQVLQLFDRGELFDIQLLARAGGIQQGARSHNDVSSQCTSG